MAIIRKDGFLGNLYVIFSCLVVFFYIYNTTLNLGGIKFPLSSLAIICGLLLIFININAVENIRMIFNTKEVFLLILFLVNFFLYSAFVEVGGGVSGGEFFFSKIVINVVVCSFFCLFFSYYLVGKQYCFNDVLILIFYIGFVNSVIVLFSFFIPDFRLYIESFLFQQTGSNIDYMAVDWRLRGVAAAGGASLSIFTAFAIVIGIICNKMQLISQHRLFICAIIMLASQFFIARTGLVVSLFFLLIWLFSEFKKFKVSFFVLLFLISYFLFWFYFQFYDQISRILPFALELFYNAFSGEGVNTGSTNELLQMLYFPDNIFYFLFGFGCFEGCSIYRSDSGYLKSISAVGVFFSLFFYISVFYILFFWLGKFFNRGVFFWRVMVIAIFVIEIKEPFIYQNYLSRALILIVSFAFVHGKIAKVKYI